MPIANSWQKAQLAADVLTLMKRGETNTGVRWSVGLDGLTVRLEFDGTYTGTIETTCADLCAAMLNALPQDTWPTR